MKLFLLEFRISNFIHYALPIGHNADTRQSISVKVFACCRGSLPIALHQCAKQCCFCWCTLDGWTLCGSFSFACAAHIVDCNIVKANMISYILITLTFYVNIRKLYLLNLRCSLTRTMDLGWAQWCLK